MGISTIDPATGDTTPAGHPDVDPESGDGPATGTGTGGSHVDTATWVLDATTITSLEQSEHDVVHPGDELYLARVAFQSTIGKADSTRSWFNGGVSQDTTIRKLKKGDSHAIPDDMGKVMFTDVRLRTLADLLQGDGPEVLGTVDVLFEDDNTAKSAIVKMMEDLAHEAGVEIGGIVESLDLLNIDADDLASELTDAAQKIEDAVMPGLGRQIGILLASVFNPDDLIGHKVSLFVAVGSDLLTLVDTELAGAVSSATGTAGALMERSYSQTFTGSSGSWKISHKVST